MSIRFISRVLLACTGCEVEFGAPEGYRNTEDARRAAAPAGWTFQPRTRNNGQPSKRLDDVCPRCTPSWQPRDVLYSRATGHQIPTPEGPRP